MHCSPIRLLALAFFTLGFAGFTQAALYRGQHASLELVADVAEIVPGETFHLGLRYELEPHWHVYWENPGASGLAPEVEWQVPEGFTGGGLEFPAPERFELGGLVSYAHEGSPLFIVPVEVPEDFPVGDTVTIGASVFWLLCNDVCIADDAELELTLAVGDVARPSENAGLFTAARLAQPQVLTGLTVSAVLVEGGVDLQFEGLAILP